MGFWSNLAQSGIGQAGIGALAGAGLAQATGQDASKGAWLGGALGGANYLSGSGGTEGLLYDASGQGFGSTALGGLMGTNTTQTGGLMNSPTNTNVAYNQANVAGSPFINQGASNVVNQPSFMSNLPSLNDTRDIMGGAGDLANAYGTYQSGEAARKNAQSEIDYRNRISALQERNYNRDFANQAATQGNVTDAFAKSKLNYYNA